MKERKYLVEWAIYLYAEDTLDAAQQAQGILADPHNTATGFRVSDGSGNSVFIDLEEVST